MNIAMTLGDFLAIAAIVVITARGSQAYFAGQTPEQLRMQRQLDAIMKHLGLATHPQAARARFLPRELRSSQLRTSSKRSSYTVRKPVKV